MGTVSLSLVHLGPHCTAWGERNILVSKHGCAVPQQRKTAVRRRSKLGVAGHIFEDVVTGLPHAAGCDVLRRHKGAV